MAPSSFVRGADAYTCRGAGFRFSSGSTRLGQTGPGLHHHRSISTGTAADKVTAVGDSSWDMWL